MTKPSITLYTSNNFKINFVPKNQLLELIDPQGNVVEDNTNNGRALLGRFKFAAFARPRILSPKAMKWGGSDDSFSFEGFGEDGKKGLPSSGQKAGTPSPNTFV